VPPNVSRSPLLPVAKRNPPAGHLDFPLVFDRPQNPFPAGSYFVPNPPESPNPAIANTIGPWVLREGSQFPTIALQVDVNRRFQRWLGPSPVSTPLPSSRRRRLPQCPQPCRRRPAPARFAPILQLRSDWGLGNLERRQACLPLLMPLCAPGRTRQAFFLGDANGFAKAPPLGGWTGKTPS